jgi:RNA polymerase sigma-70 factor (ECF subfamily)
VNEVAANSVAEAVASAHRLEWAPVLAATAQVTRDLDLAEEFTQDAYAQALRSCHGLFLGFPSDPGRG